MIMYTCTPTFYISCKHILKDVDGNTPIEGYSCANVNFSDLLKIVTVLVIPSLKRKSACNVEDKSSTLHSVCG